MLKRYLSTILSLLCALVVASSCSSEMGESQAAEGNGELSLSVTTSSRVESSDGYDPFNFCTVRIFNGDGDLVRRYAAIEDIPAKLQMLSGDYSIEVELGDYSNVSYTHKSYLGTQDFTISNGSVTAIDVECDIINTAAEVAFDESITTQFSDFAATVVVGASYDQDKVDLGEQLCLNFDQEGIGYFIMPEGETQLHFSFEGTHSTLGAIAKSFTFDDVKPAHKYSITFKFSPDLPGYLDYTLSVDESVEEFDDTIIFSPEPTIVGIGFDVKEVVRYIDGARSYRISSMADITSAKVVIDGVEYDLLNNTDPNIVVENMKSTEFDLTINEAIFAPMLDKAGNHSVQFVVDDTDGGHKDLKTTYRTRGFVEMGYDLWKNSATFEMVYFEAENPNPEVKLMISRNSGEWVEYSATTEGDDLYVANVAPTWVESLNAHKKTVYSLDTKSGIIAQSSYDYKFVSGATELYPASFTTTGGQSITDGNMENTGLSCFTTSNGSSTMWASGNNSSTSNLCKSGTKTGMGGSHCAKLAATEAFSIMATGNLYVGTFGMSGLTSGKASFGQIYPWTARPTALRFKYHASLGKVNKTDSNTPLKKGDQDQARIYAAIVDWGTRHVVTSGTGATTGSWDCTKGIDEVTEGNIVGYASLFVTESTAGDSMVTVTVPFYFYDTTIKPAAGNYSLVINAATSAYGDFKVGCATNVMYIDDFEWVY